MTFSLLKPTVEHGTSFRYVIIKYAVAGSDMALINAVLRIFKFAGRPVRVATGTKMFEFAQVVSENG